MPRSDLGLFAGCSQALQGVLAHGLQHVVATALGIQHYQGFLDQLGQQLQHVGGPQISQRGDLLRGLKAPATCKDRQASEKHALGGGEQFMAPVDQCPQGLVARQVGA